MRSMTYVQHFNDDVSGLNGTLSLMTLWMISMRGENILKAKMYRNEIFQIIKDNTNAIE